MEGRADVAVVDACVDAESVAGPIESNDPPVYDENPLVVVPDPLGRWCWAATNRPCSGALDGPVPNASGGLDELAGAALSSHACESGVLGRGRSSTLRFAGRSSSSSTGGSTGSSPPVAGALYAKTLDESGV